LRDSRSNADPRSAVLDFDKDTLAYDKSTKQKVEGMTMQSPKKLINVD
jgi:hypothetical protein